MVTQSRRLKTHSIDHGNIGATSSPTNLSRHTRIGGRVEEGARNVVIARRKGQGILAVAAIDTGIIA